MPQALPGTHHARTSGARPLIRSALLSPCLTWRYTLERVWDPTKPIVVFVLLNPSTADATRDDATLRKGMGFAKRWGYGGVVFVNLFAFRSTDPKNLTEDYAGMVGPENDRHIVEQAQDAAKVVLAWGAHGGHLGRDKHVLKLLKGIQLWHLGLTKEGHPKHPVRLAYSTPLQPWDDPMLGVAVAGLP